MDDSVIVVTGATPLEARAVDALPPDAIVIAADGALDHALAAGLEPAALVGDLDSVSPAGLAWAEAHCTIDRHPTDKDRTDTELALATAADLVPAHLTMVAGAGDRLDHTIAAIIALGHPSLTSIPQLDGWWGDQRLVVLHGPGRCGIDVVEGTTISLLALHGTCSGLSVTGVRWPLADAELAVGVGLGVSNEATDNRIEITVSAGVVTAVINPSPAREPTDAPTPDLTTEES